MFRPFLLFFLALLATPLMAEDGVFRFGDDAYIGGRDVSHDGAAVDDLFMAGDRVRSAAPVTGTAHLAGRFVDVTGETGTLYAAGMEVLLDAPVADDAVLMGETLRIEGAVGGDLRAMGSRVELRAPVAETTLLAGETLIIDAALAGDVSLAGDNVEFADGAVIEGALHIYHEDPDSIEVPERVVPANRIERHQIEAWEGIGAGDVARVTWWSVFRRVLGGIVFVSLGAIALAAIAPDFLALMRRRALDAPARTVWIGFLAMSAIAGSLFLFAITGIGLLLVPASVIGALALGFAGYVIGAYVLGVGILAALGRGAPETLGERAVAAVAGAVAVGVIALIPFLGWLFALGVMLLGAGALVVRLFAPRFFAEAA